MKLVAYLRVSTDRQAEKGLGLDVQERAIRAWCKQHRHRVTAVCRDEGVSGTLADRAGLGDALALVGRGEAAGIVVYRLDRLARDLIVQEQLLGEVWRMGGELYSTAGGEANLRDDPDDPSRRLIRQVLGAVAEYERAMTVLRLKRGRQRRHEEGRRAYGGPPYGFRIEGAELVPNPAQQKVLARIRTLHGEGASLRGIAATLTEEGHPPPRGAKWHPQTLAGIVNRLDDED